MKKIASIEFLVGILIILLISCKNGNYSPHTNNLTKFFLDSIESKYTNIRNEYYKNGNIRLIVAHRANKDTIFSVGIEIYENGYIKKVINFKNGKRDGSAQSFYSNGHLKSTVQYLNGYKVGNAYYYYKNGRLQAYNSFDLAGSDFYVILFDSSGHIIRDTGVIISENIVVSLDTLINKHRIFKFELFVACHPDYKSMVQVGQYSNKKGIFQLRNYIVNNNSILVNIITNEKNNSKLMAIGQFIDSKTGKKIKSDTMIYDVLN